MHLPLPLLIPGFDYPADSRLLVPYTPGWLPARSYPDEDRTGLDRTEARGVRLRAISDVMTFACPREYRPGAKDIQAVRPQERDCVRFLVGWSKGLQDQRAW